MTRTHTAARLRTHLSAALLLGALTACTGGGAQNPPPAAGVASITLSPATLDVAVGATAALSATARDAQGHMLSGVTYTWASSAEAVASVAGGVVSGVSAGTASITASAGGVTSAPVTVTVHAPSTADFDLSLSTDKLPVVTGTSASLTVTVTRRSGFTGAVALTLDGLPTGASGGAVTIPEGQTSTTVTVSAAVNAPHSLPTAVTLRGVSGGMVASRTVTVTVRGPAGSVDTTFAGGTSVVDFGGKDDYARALARQTDGKVLIAGYAPGAGGEGQVFVLTRLTFDGALDSTFGQGGTVRLNFGAGNDQAYALAVQPDGKIVVAGFADAAGNRDFGVARLNADGTPDASFGSGGRVTVAVGAGEDRAHALLLQPDGKIVLGGTSASGATGLDFAVVRLTSTGSVDTSFGAGGKATTSISAGGGSDVVYALALQGDRIVAAGGETDFMLARFTAAGALDTAFSGDGKVKGLFGSSVGAARAVTVIGAGAGERLLLAGNANNNTAAARLTPDGSLDAAFGDAGKTVIAVSGDWDEAASLAVQADDKIVLGGWANDTTTTANVTVLRLSAGGQPDVSFGGDGVVVTPLAPAGKNDFGRALLLQPDDRIPATRVIVAGERVPGFSDFAATRYWP